MSISSIKRRLSSCRALRPVTRVIMMIAIGAGLTACVVHEPNYRAYRHYGSHVTVIEKQPRSGYRHRHVRSRPDARRTARPTRPHARRGARSQARPAATSRRTAGGGRKSHDGARRR